MSVRKYKFRRPQMNNNRKHEFMEKENSQNFHQHRRRLAADRSRTYNSKLRSIYNLVSTRDMWLLLQREKKV